VKAKPQNARGRRAWRRTLRLHATRFAHAVWAKKGWMSTALLPLAWLTALVVWWRNRRARPLLQRRVPVVVVGNILVGGTGKTPVVLAVIEALQARGFTPGLISRGYGAPPAPTPRHGVGRLDAALFGDEPALIAAHTGVPVAVHRDRAHALQVLEQFYPGVDVVVSDDGLQHLALPRDLEIAVQDRRGCGNGRLLPAGPLREPARRLARVDFLITQAETALDGEHAPLSTSQSANLAARGELKRGSHLLEPKAAQTCGGQAPDARPGCCTPPKLPPTVVQSAMVLRPAVMQHLATASRMPFEDWLAHYADVTVAAVAGIGVPERFFQMLRSAGVRVEHAVGLADHDDFRHPPFDHLPAAPILITPKDAVKCAQLQDTRLWVVHPKADFSNPAWLDVLVGRLRHLQWQGGESGEMYGSA